MYVIDQVVLKGCTYIYFQECHAVDLLLKADFHLESNWRKYIKGQVAWISEKQRLPVKTSAKASFYSENLHWWAVLGPREREIM